MILKCYLAPFVAVTYHAALRCLLLCSTVCHIIPLLCCAGRGWMQTYLLFSNFSISFCWHNIIKKLHLIHASLYTHLNNTRTWTIHLYHCYCCVLPCVQKKKKKNKIGFTCWYGATIGLFASEKMNSMERGRNWSFFTFPPPLKYFPQTYFPQVNFP